MLLEIFNGGTIYKYFESTEEIKEFREKNPGFIGQLWTDDGYQIEETDALVSQTT